jgi:hypothetical protein
MTHTFARGEASAHDFAIAQSAQRQWDHFSLSRIGGATFSGGAGGSAG